jgi:hypothetical protein
MLLAACGDGGASSPDARTDCSGFVGDRALPVEVEALVGEPDPQGLIRPIVAGDGARVPLVASPMGSVFIHAAARAKNVDTCSTTVRVALRDMSDPGFSQERPLKLILGGDGWSAPTKPATTLPNT